MEQIINNQEVNPVKRSYTTLWVMIILFAMPYVAATYFYLNQDKIDLPSSNYGEFVSPMRPVSGLGLNTLDNKGFSFLDVKGKWVLLTIGDSSCMQVCQENMYKMRQIRKAVGQERGRVERVFLLTDTTQRTAFAQKLKDYKGMIVALANTKTHTDLLASFELSSDASIQNILSSVNSIYIIDPLGNIMMAYPEGADAEGILKDVRRLLLVSKIG